jgi:xanthine dehydrogenase YagS FAD-binding subunit
MQAFKYAHPKTLAEALPLLGSQWGETEILAGGTDLLSLMKNEVATPKRVVNIKAIGELRGIHQVNSGWRIGALTTLEEVEEHNGLAPAIRQAAAGVTSPQLRTMGTVGGDLLQRPRCWYYRAGHGLLARDPAGKPLVPNGENRYHAILGNAGPAYFVHPSSLAPALIACGASAVLAGPKGERRVPLSEFFFTPKNEGERETLLQPNEILTQIEIQLPQLKHGSATYEVRQREAMDWPLATASVAVGMTNGRVGHASIVLGHVAPIPWQAQEASEWIVGKPLNEETAAKAGEAAVHGAKPLSQNGYKVQLAKVAVKRALLAAAGKGV